MNFNDRIERNLKLALGVMDEEVEKYFLNFKNEPSVYNLKVLIIKSGLSVGIVLSNNEIETGIEKTEISILSGSWEIAS